jgi:hypothetical protein
LNGKKCSPLVVAAFPWNVAFSRPDALPPILAFVDLCSIQIRWANPRNEFGVDGQKGGHRCQLDSIDLAQIEPKNEWELR